MSAYGNVPKKMVALMLYGTLRRARELEIQRGKQPHEVRDLPPLDEFLEDQRRQLREDQSW